LFFSVQLPIVNLLKIVPLTTDLLNEVVELDRLCFGQLWTLEGYQRELASPNSEILLLKIQEKTFENGKSSISERVIGIGCFWIIVDEAHITILAIHPDYQNRGLGQLMLYSLLKKSSHLGLERATLEVRDTNKSALSLYQKFGFKIAGRRKNYYQKTGEDALVLWCKDINKSEFQDNLALWEEEIKQRLDREYSATH
jgi:[ribosomal protein S18]-alanine N-acetyltransferase